MKKLTLLVIVLLLLSFGCSTLQNYDRSCYLWASRKTINTISKAESRGYVTLDEWQLLKKASNSSTICIDIVIQKDLLPYRGMFYVSVEKENYKEAERIRKEWLRELQSLVIYTNEGPMSYTFPMKLMSEINKLENIVGLKDPMLMALRKELAVAINNRDWDNAQKIQNLITARTNELRPRQHYEGQPGGTVIVQQPSRIQVEQVPRYGAEDIGRAISLLQGKGGSLTSKEAGALKILDILMKR